MTLSSAAVQISDDCSLVTVTLSSSLWSFEQSDAPQVTSGADSREVVVSGEVDAVLNAIGMLALTHDLESYGVSTVSITVVDSDSLGAARGMEHYGVCCRRML